MEQVTLAPRLLDLMDMWYEFFGEYKDPSELLYLNINALHAWFAHRKGVKFFHDYPLRPQNMQ